MQARKTTFGLDGQHQDVDRTVRGRVSQNDRGQGKWRKYVHGVASPRIEDGYRTEQNLFRHLYLSTAPPLSVPFFQLFLSTPLCPILSLFSLFLLYHTAEIQRRGLRER